MASTYERLHDEAVHHRIGLSRYSTTLVRKVLATLKRTDEALVARIAAHEGDTARLEWLLEEVRAEQARGWAIVRERVEGDLGALAAVEAEYAAKAVRFGAASAGVEITAGLPAQQQIVAAVKARPFQGRFLRDWLSGAEEGAARRVRETLRQGFIDGSSVSDMVRTIRGSKALGYRDGVLEISRRGAEAMVRTAVTHTASVARDLTHEAFADVLEGWEFVATLDSRTTPICGALDGRVFDIGKGPKPPRHVSCRSTTIPRVKGVPTIDRPTYGEWLKRQSAETQDDILGPTKGKLFREGGLTVDRFTDRGKELTLEQLRARDASAFARAGV